MRLAYVYLASAGTATFLIVGLIVWAELDRWVRGRRARRQALRRGGYLDTRRLP